MTAAEQDRYQKMPTDESEAQTLASADLDYMKSEWGCALGLPSGLSVLGEWAGDSGAGIAGAGITGDGGFVTMGLALLGMVGLALLGLALLGLVGL